MITPQKIKSAFLQSDAVTTAAAAAAAAVAAAWQGYASCPCWRPCFCCHSRRWVDEILSLYCKRRAAAVVDDSVIIITVFLLFPLITITITKRW